MCCHTPLKKSAGVTNATSPTLAMGAVAVMTVSATASSAPNGPYDSAVLSPINPDL